MAESGIETEQAVIIRSGELWNFILTLEDFDKNDLLVLNEAIHRIQDMMYTRLYIKKFGKL